MAFPHDQPGTWTSSAYPQPSKMQRSGGSFARWMTWSMSCKYLQRSTSRSQWLASNMSILDTVIVIDQIVTCIMLKLTDFQHLSKVNGYRATAADGRNQRVRSRSRRGRCLSRKAQSAGVWCCYLVGGFKYSWIWVTFLTPQLNWMKKTMFTQNHQHFVNWWDWWNFHNIHQHTHKLMLMFTYDSSCFLGTSHFFCPATGFEDFMHSSPSLSCFHRRPQHAQAVRVKVVVRRLLEETKDSWCKKKLAQNGTRKTKLSLISWYFTL